MIKWSYIHVVRPVIYLKVLFTLLQVFDFKIVQGGKGTSNLNWLKSMLSCEHFLDLFITIIYSEGYLINIPVTSTLNICMYMVASYSIKGRYWLELYSKDEHLELHLHWWLIWDWVMSIVGIYLRYWPIFGTIQDKNLIYLSLVKYWSWL